MKKLFASLVFVFLLTIGILGQTPTPTATPIEDEGDVVKISTTLIQIDVTVTNKNGKVVSDLKPEEIEIYENGKKQEITNFSYVSAAPETAPLAEPKEKEKKSDIPLPPSGSLKPEQVRRTIALVVDDLGLSFESVYQVRRALRKFVDEQMQPNDLVAIVRTGGGIGAQQQFTSDKRQLYATIENIKWNALGRSGITAFEPLEATPQELSKASGNPVSDEELEEEQKQIKSFNDFREDAFSVGTLGAINFIIKGMSDLPGRKSVMLFSDGFGVCTAEDTDRCARIVDTIRQLTDLSNRAAVTIYTFDARGLQVTGLTARDNTSGVDAERVQNLNSSRSAEIFDKQEGLAYLARETGGRAFFNSNDINNGLEKALEDQKGYYLIGYQPDNETFDAKTRRFNKLEVKVIRKDTNVRYRSGFFGIADEKTKKPVNQTAAQQIYTALVSPFAVSDIELRLNTLFGNDKQGSFVRSLLHVNAKNLKFTDDTDGTKKAAFDVLAMIFGENGTMVEQIGKSYTINVKNDKYQEFLDKGFVYYFTLPVKKAGAYQYRVAIRDSTSGKLGSANQFIETANLKKNSLTVSGIILENLTLAQWQKLGGSNSSAQPSPSENNVQEFSNSLIDTSLRRFKRGTILRYGFEVYNAKTDASQKTNLSSQIRIFRDGKIILQGKSVPLDILEQTDLQRIKSSGAVSLGTELPPSEYVLQIIITDNLAKEKRRLATQFVQFEIQ